MGVTDSVPENEYLVQASMQLDFINNFLCSSVLRTADIISQSQLYLFKFGVSLPRFFSADITTKLHRLMRHVERHLVLLGCLRRGCSEENVIEGKAFKAVYCLTNKLIHSLGQQLFTSWTDCSLRSSGVIVDNDHDLPIEPTVHLHYTFPSDVNDIINLCCQLSGR